jgi:hypothetical protein
VNGKFVKPTEVEGTTKMNQVIEHEHVTSETHSIYAVLAKHQRDEAWDRRKTVADLQEWVARFIDEFKLAIPEIALSVDPLPANRYGHYRQGHNGFGLRGEIAINTRYLDRALWEVLGTLLHELLHAWQDVNGTPGKRNHHNAEFQAKARELGLVIDSRGLTGYSANSPFKDLLGKHGVLAPAHEIVAPKAPPRGDSKMKKWTCGCTTVRVAVADFRARCLKCEKEFKRDDPAANATKEEAAKEAA